MSTTVGEAIVKLKADAKPLEQGLQEAESKSMKLFDKVTTGIGKAIGARMATVVTEATTAVTGILKKSLDYYSTYEQTVGGVESLFGTAAETIKQNAEEAYRTAGVNANDYMEQAVTFSATLIRNLGGDTEKAAELTDMAIKDMADNVNKLGTDAEMVKNAYAGLARGNATMLDNLRIGYAGTQKEALQLAKDMGVVGDEVESFADLGFDKSIEAIHKLQQELEITGTTEQEAIDTIQGSQKMAKAAIQDLVRGLADPNANLDNLFDNAIGSVIAFGKNIGEAVMRALPSIVKVLPKVIKAMTDALPTVIQELLPVLADAVIEIANELMKATPALVDAFLKVALNIIIQVAQNLPQILSSIVTAILGIVNVLLQPDNLLLLQQAFLELLLGLVRAIPEIIVAFNEAMPTLFENLVDMLLDPNFQLMLLEAGVELFLALVEAVPKILNSLIEAWKKIFGKLWEVTKKIFGSFAADFGKGMSNAVISGLNKMLDFVEGVLNGPINAINGVLDAINAIPGVDIQKVQTIQLARIPLQGEAAMATGGLVNSPIHALIGEAGPEAVIPLTRDTGWAKAIATALGQEFASEGFSGANTVNVYMTNEINNKLDINEVCREMVTSIRRAI